MRALVLVWLVGCVNHATDYAGGGAPLPTDEVHWDAGATLHADDMLVAKATAGARTVHAIWISGSNGNRVPIAISAVATDGEVGVQLLGPEVDGARPVLASADGRVAEVAVDIAAPGEHLVVVGGDADVAYELRASCVGAGCGVSRIDALATPKTGALVDHQISLLLGDAIVSAGLAVDVEAWASPPLHAEATRVAVASANGAAIDVALPTSVRPGDDVRLVVRESGGHVLDTGVTTRYAHDSAFARLDDVVYSDLGDVQIAGVVSYFEGVADLRLVSEQRHVEVARDLLTATHPGQAGNGLASFDATFAAPGASDGELLSIGWIDGNGAVRRLGCFEYCNNLSGLSSCTGGPRDCP